MYAALQGRQVARLMAVPWIGQDASQDLVDVIILSFRGCWVVFRYRVISPFRGVWITPPFVAASNPSTVATRGDGDWLPRWSGTARHLMSGDCLHATTSRQRNCRDTVQRYDGEFRFLRGANAKSRIQPDWLRPPRAHTLCCGQSASYRTARGVNHNASLRRRRECYPAQRRPGPSKLLDARFRCKGGFSRRAHA